MSPKMRHADEDLIFLQSIQRGDFSHLAFFQLPNFIRISYIRSPESVHIAILTTFPFEAIPGTSETHIIPPFQPMQFQLARR